MKILSKLFSRFYTGHRITSNRTLQQYWVYSLAYEASRRYFAKEYGPKPPVYILLACGSTGGVSPLDIVSCHWCHGISRLPIGYRVIHWVRLLCHFRPPESLLTLSVDVVKSRIQLRPIPPSGTPVQYIARELKQIVHESGLYVFTSVILPNITQILGLY